MKIIIDIPDKYTKQFYKNKCKEKFDSLATNEFGYVLRKAFEVAKPLPKGKWLDKKMTIKGAHGMAYGRYACSVCKKKFPNKSNYCPNCGADMREEERNEQKNHT